MSGESEPRDLEHVTIWVNAARAGDHDAFNRLCDPGSVRRWLVMIAMMLPRRLRAKVDAEDVLQETLHRAWNDLGTLREVNTPGFRRWVLGIARRVVTDHVRRFQQQKRDPAREEQYRTSTGEAAAAPVDTPSQVVSQREQATRVVDLLEQLKDPYRAVIVHRILEDYSTREVADLMGTSVENVRVMLHRALIQFRDLMDEEGVPPSIF